MNILNFLKTKDINSQKHLWCQVRKKYVVFLPEEAVRQEFITYLHKNKSYPLTLMKVERIVPYPNMQKRSDIAVYDRNGRVKMLVECKAPSVKIRQDAFHQIAQYNQQLRVTYLAVTNGKEHYCCKINFTTGDISFLDDFPDFKEL